MPKLFDRFQRAVERQYQRSALDVEELARIKAREWKQIDDAIRRGGDPRALGGPFMGFELTPSIVNLATVTGGATELALWPIANSPIPANVQAPKFYRLYASGTSTTAATPGTFTFAPRIGNANNSPLIGIATGAITPVASATAAQWRLEGWVYVRNGGATTVATAQASFEFNMSATIGGGGPASATSNAVFGGISAGFDATAATNGLWMGVTHATSTTNTWVPQFVGWASMN